MIAAFFAWAPLALNAALPAPASHGGGTVAVRAGTIHLVESGSTLENGTILVRDGHIEAVGEGLSVPPGMRVVDYGSDAVIVPGFVAADSSYGSRAASARTAEPGLLAVDGFDPYTTYAWALSSGVTSAYIAPARGRLIAGQGAVVKLAGAVDNGRVVNARAALHGAISDEARRTPGYWEPPVPATVDVGLGVAQPQLPKTVTGAIVALRELLELARGGEGEDEYGPYAGPALMEVLRRGTPWRLGAQSEAEVRALIEFAPELKQPLVIDGALGAGDFAAELAAAGIDVIVDAPIRPNRSPRDFGKEQDAVWPRYDVAARMAAAGVRFAIATPDSVSVRDLLFAARSASRGGLAPHDALRAITLSPAEMLGVADRVGSLEPTKDADFVVMNGHPLSGGASVLATWVEGELVWDRESQASASSGASHTPTSVVIDVDSLHLGDGNVLSPGQVLLQDGHIVQVGSSVAVPPGARVVRGAAAMPGMIDALGHLGLEGSKKVPSTDFKMSRIIEPGDFADRRVAKSGVTTVALSPRGASKKGAPILAYKPAGQSLDSQIVDEPAALRFQWTQRDRRQSGNDVRAVLKKTVEYDKAWKAYEEALAKWTPPAPKPAEDKEDEEDEDEDEKDSDDGKKDDKKKKKKKKKKDIPAKPVTGAWVAFVSTDEIEESRMRLYVHDDDGEVAGSLRCAALTDGLIDIEGMRDERKVTLTGYGTRGEVSIEADVEDPEDDDEPRLLKGTVTVAGQSIEFEAEQTSTEYVIAKRPERRRPEPVKEEKVKGAPKKPRVDKSLEPMRHALEGKLAVLVAVERKDEILACVDAFEAAGIQPVLVGASDAHKVKDQLVGRVAGVLLSHQIVRTDVRTGTQWTNRYAELAGAGIPVAFHSAAEEGAAELPMVAAYAVSQGMSAAGAVKALTADAAKILAIEDRVGTIASGLDGDVLLLDGDPFDPATSVVRVWVNGEEVR